MINRIKSLAIALALIASGASLGQTAEPPPLIEEVVPTIATQDVAQQSNFFDNLIIADNVSAAEIESLNSVSMPPDGAALRGLDDTASPADQVNRRWETTTIFDLTFISNKIKFDHARRYQYDENRPRIKAKAERERRSTMTAAVVVSKTLVTAPRGFRRQLHNASTATT